MEPVQLFALLFSIGLVSFFVIRSLRGNFERQYYPVDEPDEGEKFISKNNLKFDDLTNDVRALEQLGNDRIARINNSISGGGKAIVDTVKYLNESGTYLVTFSKEGRRLLGSSQAQLMRRGDDLVPVIRGAGGKFKEHSKLVNSGRQVFSKLSNVANIVVSAAHIISGADQMKMLRTIDGKLDFLIQDRSNEMKAHLESIFDYMIELELSANENAKKQELGRLSRDIYQLRNNWNRNLRSKLNDIENEHHHGFFRKKFGWGKKKRDRSMSSKIANGTEEIIMIRVSLMLQMILFHERGESEIFQEHILPRELAKISRTRELLEEKTEYITSTFKESEQSLLQIKQHYDQTLIEFEQLSIKEINSSEVDAVQNTMTIDGRIDFQLHTPEVEDVLSLSLNAGECENAQVKIKSSEGQIIHVHNVSGDNQRIDMPFTEYDSGIYEAVFTADNIPSVLKSFIKV